ncbi:hypothetical protein [Tenacibaculum sp. 190524A05c]|uniref:hypothetical protein n=1 Tax=Tenacibaculum platacis TaxID=3137852 RepID=UPI0031FB689E
MKKTILNFGKTLNRTEQKEINGGGLTLIKKCVGTGVGGGSTEGYSTACIGHIGDCVINGHLAKCSGNGGPGFWFY